MAIDKDMGIDIYDFVYDTFYIKFTIIKLGRNVIYNYSSLILHRFWLGLKKVKIVNIVVLAFDIT